MWRLRTVSTAENCEKRQYMRGGVLLYAFYAVWISLLPMLCHFSAFLFS